MADRFLKAALVFTVLAHAVAMATMALLLLPGVPGGTPSDLADRAMYVAVHPWLWRAGWLPWQVTAASDLLLGWALLRTPWIPRVPAAFALIATAIGVAFDQSGQFLWTWRGVDEATRAVRTGDLEAYRLLESTAFRLTAGCGPVGYLAGAIGWTWCFAAARAGSRRLVWIAVTAWTLFAATIPPVFLPDALHANHIAARAVSLGNAVAFVLLMAWFVGITEGVFRRGCSGSQYGSGAPWRHPARFPFSIPANVLANSRTIRAVSRRLPAAAMESEITNVVYINYLVDAERLNTLVARPLALQRLGPDGRYALFTFLTFRHGHFGPACFGRWRRLWPSPIQSNWRIHVVNPSTGTRGIQFLTTAITSTPHALAARLLSDGVPMHVPRSAILDRRADGSIALILDPGSGSSPDARAELTLAPEPVLQGPWSSSFANWRGLLAYCVPQDRAMTVEPAGSRVIRQEIQLNIRLEECVPLAGVVESEAARRIVGDSSPLCFVVDHVRFRFAGQEWDG
jgi:hypothetical protein